MLEQLSGGSVVWFWLVCATLLLTLCCAAGSHSYYLVFGRSRHAEIQYRFHL